jgi:hypothetical protein
MEWPFRMKEERGQTLLQDSERDTPIFKEEEMLCFRLSKF